MTSHPLTASFRLVLMWFVCALAACGGQRTTAPLPTDGGRTELDGGATQTDSGVTRMDGGARVDGGAIPRDGGTAPGVTFPLQISPNRRFLTDQAGHPFLINQASSWGLVQSLSTPDATAYLDGLAARSFNAILVSVISNDVRMPGNPPAWRGIQPFLKQWDFSTPNPSYFDHADAIFELAKQRGMLVNVVPCYLGFADDATQGWEDELLSDQNSVEKSRAYGRFLGQRYRHFDNLVWVAGGDNLPAAGSELEAHLQAVVDGIREQDPDHLWTAHWSGLEEGSLSTDNPTFAKYIDLNGYYAFNFDLTYTKDLTAYAATPIKPLFHLDMSYETELGGSPDDIRRKAYTALLSGAVGSSFNAGPAWYLFRNWRNMNSQGTRETKYWYQLFASRPWQDLVPDTDHEAITDGYGMFGSEDYVCAAHTADWTLIVAYLPQGGSVTVQLELLHGERARVYWYDPTSGQARLAGQYAAAGSMQFRAPSNDSWTLVVEDASMPWQAPGILPNAAGNAPP